MSKINDYCFKPLHFGLLHSNSQLIQYLALINKIDFKQNLRKKKEIAEKGIQMNR